MNATYWQYSHFVCGLTTYCNLVRPIHAMRHVLVYRFNGRREQNLTEFVWHGVVVLCVPDAYRCSTVGGYVVLARKLGVCRVMQSVLLIKIQLGRQLARHFCLQFLRTVNGVERVLCYFLPMENSVVHQSECRNIGWCILWRSADTLLRRSSLSNCRAILWYMRKCNFIYTHKRGVAFPALIFTKITNSGQNYT